MHGTNTIISGECWNVCVSSKGRDAVLKSVLEFPARESSNEGSPHRLDYLGKEYVDYILTFS